MNKWLFVLVFVLSLGLVSAATTPSSCTYTTATGGADFFGVNTASVNTTAVSDSVLIGSFSAFTPRLNFTRNVTDVLLGGNTTVVSYFNWLTPVNFSSTLVLHNNSELIGAANYSLTNPSGNLWAIVWVNANYKDKNITANFNRTFIKNVDDVVVSPGSIYLGANTASFITQSTPAEYGVAKTFELSMEQGQYANNSNWAVEWSETTRSNCLSCTSGVDGTLFTVIVTIFIIGILVFVAYSMINGALSTELVVGAVIAVILMLVAMSIINSTIHAVCL